MCDILYEVYKPDDFIRQNQSYTSLAVSIHRQMDGYTYLSRTTIRKQKQMLDNNSPKALQWCTTGKVPSRGVINIDISKSYPAE